MQNEFKEIIDEICKHYYKTKNLPMELLAEEIGIDKRTLQKWKSTGHRPREDSINLLINFLYSNDGGQFIVRLSQALGESYITINNENNGTFPPNISNEDINNIKANFPGYDELSFLCAMILYNNKAKAVSEMMPDADIVQKAALISKYETSMEKAKRIFGFGDIYEWKDKVIQYVTKIPKTPNDIEVLGQKALNNIIEGYFKCKEVFL